MGGIEIRKCINKIILILIIFIISIGITTNSIIGEKIQEEKNIQWYDIEEYFVPTEDGFFVTLTRYLGDKRPSILLIHGMGCNHRIFDWDENHSLARYLAGNGFDVWLLDLRTHDGDGDFLFGRLRGIDSEKEKINRYWDFDRTLLKKDVVAGVDFTIEKSQFNKVILGGHSYGGYLAYAYAELIGQEKLAGIVTTGASGLANPSCVMASWRELYSYGIKIGNRAFVNPFGKATTARIRLLFLYKYYGADTSGLLFYKNTTPLYIQKEARYCSDDEAAGVWVDMFFGKDPRFYDGHWVDPQTLFDYTENLKKITVPFLAIAGDEDPQDPVGDIFETYVKVNSEFKRFLHYPKHFHMDLLFGDNADTLIFPDIVDWLDTLICE